MHIETTATVYIAYPEEPKRVLLRWHTKFKSWLPPGGHSEPGEVPYLTAIREAKEETGLDIELIGLNPFLINEPKAKSVPQPYLCLLENVQSPPHGLHQHMDFIYLGIAKNLSELEPESPHAKLKWFTLEDVKALPEEALFKDVRRALHELLDPYCPSPLFDNEAFAPIRLKL